MNFVRRIADLDTRSRVSAFGPTRDQGQVELSERRTVEYFETSRIFPVQLSHPEIDEVLVKQLNVPGIACLSFGPVHTTGSHGGVEGVCSSCHVVTAAQSRTHCHPAEHVVRLRCIGLGDWGEVGICGVWVNSASHQKHEQRKNREVPHAFSSSRWIGPAPHTVFTSWLIQKITEGPPEKHLANSSC